MSQMIESTSLCSINIDGPILSSLDEPDKRFYNFEFKILVSTERLLCQIVVVFVQKTYFRLLKPNLLRENKQGKSAYILVQPL